MLLRQAAASLLFVEESLKKQGYRNNLISRRVQQIGIRYVSSTDRFAFTAAQAKVLISSEICLASLFLHNDRLMAKQIKAGRVSQRKVGLRSELAFVEMTLRINSV